MNKMAAIPGFYSVYEASSIIGKSHSQVCKYVRDGLLPGVKVGNNVLIEQAKVHEFVPPPRGNPNFRAKAKV